ncbi:hypothetical protein SCHPADRAFT_892058 [Schizopora paradoxa]|uniref:Uncharacterized protein n=1 Tax=Schizopora paradoxa TaxID=27342 RepID=A0A0H2S1B0_9AGAM|nr:hypothetical protein SCHPADRAFT_892058 [Schizopora paradoxa]
MALAGDVGVGSADALFGAVLNHGSLAQGLDVMHNEGVLPDNASFVAPYILANEYSIQAHAMSLYSVLESSGTLHAEPTRTSTVAHSVKGTLDRPTFLTYPKTVPKSRK